MAAAAQSAAITSGEQVAMTILGKLRARARRESFQPTWLNAIVSPDFIIRRGLFLAIGQLAPSISGSVLDFGCGSKPYESLFSNAEKYVGVDVEVTGHDHIDSKVDVFYDGKTLPFRDGEFHAVVSFEVFEHVFNLPEVLREIHRVTRESGHLLISIPFAWQEHEIPYDYARYTSFGISDLLRKSGYDVVELRKTTTYLLAIGQLFIAYLTQLAPKTRMLRHLFQLLVISPCTLAALAVNFIAPKRYEYFCNCVVLARKQTGSAQQ
jgi:SAM-dependent methyltransferase